MAKKTSRQIQGDIYRLLRGSELADAISGGVYRDGMRPRDSEREDAVVIFTTGLTEQIQSGALTLHVYVPDIDPFCNGVRVENIQRTEEIEGFMQDFVGSLTAGVSNYLFELRQTISTDYNDEIKQHFVVAVLGYEYYDGED